MELLSADYAWPEEKRDSGDAKAQLEKLKNKITARLVCDSFTTPDHLANRVTTGLANLPENRATPDPYVLVVGSASGEYVLRLDSPLKVDQKQSVDSGA